jgi:hypothetical protein
MSSRGIEYVYLETHNWGKTARFWQGLGYELELDLGSSGRLVHPEGGVPIFIEEVPADRDLAVQLYLCAGSEIEPEAPVVKGWHDSHWGTRLLEIEDPDERTIFIQHHP